MIAAAAVPTATIIGATYGMSEWMISGIIGTGLRPKIKVGPCPGNPVPGGADKGAVFRGRQGWFGRHATPSPDVSCTFG